jgi:signal transduction histidine kinase/putative methionine-R-sulfoxide reductase with GAF domain
MHNGATAARTAAEAANAQLQAMQALTDTALSHLALDDLLPELLGRVTSVMGVDNVTILLLDEDAQTLTVRAACGPAEEGIGQVRILVGQGFSGRIAASREPLIVNDLTTFDGVYPRMREDLYAVVGVPLEVADQVSGHLVDRLVGVIHAGSTAPRRFTADDVQLLQHAADRIAIAIHRALMYAAEQDARRRAEAALVRALVSETQATERAQRLHTILETMADGVVVYDAAGRFVQMNHTYRAMIALDHGPADFESLPMLERGRLLQFRDAVTGAPLPLERIPIMRALEGEVVTGPEADLRARAFDGRELEVNAGAAPLCESEGHVVGAVMVLRDLTEHNRLEREREAAHTGELTAREASQRMEEFLATATHDLRTPLAATVGYIDLAEQKTERLADLARETCPALAPRLEAVRERVSDAGQSAERLAQQLTLLFDTAAVRAGRLEFHRAPFDLVALMRQQVEALRMAAPGRIIRLRVLGGSEPIIIDADADRIRQVVANYVTNALKYSPPHQPVDVFVQTRRGQACVAVRDAGQGIPKAERVRVWELFHRAPEVAAQGKTYGGSLGLGLHISKAIIEGHGGRVGVKSRVGQGSTFWFTLPMGDPTPDRAGAAP